ncbi:hypothetical protein G5B38_02340 [Pseudohalocynthiibacter aestuariivivens]|nr:hypothetical protein [Pseudohalocynthiibacter aestuariivivens]QIE44457.1 hypothetical protein G5B38_02340 [Pseudohalocynthiibacter aestuariivivens]
MNPQYSEFTYDLAAGASVEISRVASFVVCLAATGPFHIGFDQSPMSEFRQGLTFSPDTDFGKTRIENRGNEAISVTLGFGRGGIADARLVLSGPLDVSPVSANDLEAVAPVLIGAGTAVEVAAANARRRDVIIRNLSVSQQVWVMGTAATSQVGHPLDGKEGLSLPHNGPVAVYNPTGAAVQVSVLELEYSA